MRAYGLRIGERVWYAGTGWIVADQNPDGSWLLRSTDGRSSRVIVKRDRVWVREPSRFENQRPPDAPKKKRKHAHRWKDVAAGRGRLCEVCGRGEIKTPKGWRRAT